MFVRPLPLRRLLPVFAAALAMLVAVEPAHAQTDYYWNAPTGGTGTWDITTQDWSTVATGPVDYIWTNSGSERANFGNTAGTVTLSVPITAFGLNFTTTGYTITGSTLTLGTGVGAGVIDTGGVSATIGSIVAGSTGLTKANAGALTLTGLANTYTGVTMISGGVLSVAGLANGGSNSSIGASSNAAGNLVFNGGTLTFASSGSGNTNTFTDRLFTLTQNGGTIDASGTFPLVMTNTGAVAFTGSGPRTMTLTGTNPAPNSLAAALGDNGADVTSLVKSGTGTWVLAGANSYSGGTTISGGTLSVAGDSNLGNAAGPLALSGGGTLLVTGVGFTSARAVTLGAGGGVVALLAGQSGTLSGPVGGAGGFTLNNGTLTFGSGGNSYAGGTTVIAATLIATAQASGTPFGSTTGAVSLNGGALQLTGIATPTTTTAGDLTAAGGSRLVIDNTAGGGTTFAAGNLVRSGAGTLIVTPVTGGLAAGEKVTFTGGTALSATNGPILPPWFVAQASGANPAADFVTYGGNGLVVATYSPNTLTTPSTNSDVVNQTTPAALGGNAAAYALKTNQVIVLGTNTITLGTGSGQAGLILNAGGSLSGGTLAFGGAEGTVYVSGAASIGSAVAGSGGLTVFGPGALALSSANTYTGTTRVQNATLSVSSDANLGAVPAVPTPGSLVLNGGTLSAANGFTLAPNRGIALGPTAGVGTGTFNIASGTVIYGGVLTNNGAGIGGLVKTGAGTLQLIAQNTFTGDVTISGGTLSMFGPGQENNTLPTPTTLGLQINNGGFVPKIVTINGGTLQILGATYDPGVNTGPTKQIFIGPAGGTIDLNATSILSLNDLYQFGGTGNLTKTGQGVLTIGAAAIGYNFTGNTTVNGGTLNVINANSLGSGTSQTITVNNGGALDVRATLAAKPLTIQGAGPDQNGALIAGAAGTYTGSVTFAAATTVGGTAALAISGPITSTTGITKANSNTLTLSGANSITGPTVVNGGTLTISDAANTAAKIDPASPVTLENNGSLSVTGGTAATSQAISGLILNKGGHAVNVTGGAGGATLALGAITRNPGSAVNFTTSGTAPAITTTTANTATSILGGWATVAGANWAVSAGNGTTAGAISALGTYGTNTFSSGTNSDVTSSQTPGAVITTNSLRFNTNTGAALTLTLTGTTNVIQSGGILETNAVGAFATTITGGTFTTGSGTNTDLVIHNYNTTSAGTLVISSVIGANGTGGVVVAGAAGTTGGRVILNATNTFTGGVTVATGFVEARTANSLGATGTGGSVVTLANIQASGGNAPRLDLHPTSAVTYNAAVVLDPFTPAATIDVNRNSGSTTGLVQTVLSLTFGSAATPNVATQTLTVQGANSYAFAVSGTTTLNNNAIINSSTANTTLTGIVSDGATTFSLGKIGAGTLTLNNANTYKGGTLLSVGVLQVNNDAALGTGPLTVTGGTLQDNGAVRTLANTLVITGAAATTFTTATAGSAGSLIFTNPVTIQTVANPTLTINNATAFNGAVLGSALTKAGTGTLSFGAAANYGGTVTLNAGAVAFVGPTMDQNFLVSHIPQASAGGTIALANATNTANLDVSVYPNTALRLGAFGATTADFSGTLTPLAVATVPTYRLGGGGTVATPSTLQMSSAMSVVGSVLDITSATGPGTIILNNTGNAFTSISVVGSTTAPNSPQTLQFNFNDGNAGDATGVLGVVPSTPTANITLDNGGLKFGPGVTNINPNRSITLNAGGGTIDTNGNNATMGNALTGAGSLTKTGAGTLTLTGTNTFTGVLNVTGGILNVASLSDYGVASAIGARTAAQETATGNGIGIHLNGGTLQYTGSTAQSTNRQIRILNGTTPTIDASGTNPSATLSFTFTGPNTNLFDTPGTRTLNLTGSNTGNNTFAIPVTDQSANATSLTKSGVGTWVLSGTSTYTGATTVNGGTLVLAATGSIGGSSAVTIAAGATLDVSATSGLIVGTGKSLAGNGTLVGSSTIGGTLKPGSSPGILTISGGASSATMTWSQGGTYNYDYNASASDPAPVDGTSDLVKGTGASVLDLSGLTNVAGQQFNLALIPTNTPTTPTSGVRYTIADFSASTNGTPILTPGGATDLTPFFNITGTFNGGPGPGGTPTVALVGGNLVQVTFTPVPEPAFVLLACGAGAIGWWTRRRRPTVGG